jgi:Domain of unknown function (DUF4157)
MGAATTPPTVQAQHASPRRSPACTTQQGIAPARSGISRLQRAVGNRGMRRLLRPVTIQPKLTVGRADDQHEREADRVADEVMRMPERSSGSALQRAPLSIQRMCPECEEEKEKPVVQAKRDSDDSIEVSSELQSYLATSRGSGQPLSDSARSYLEPRFGYDFGHVRVHANQVAAEAARAINARAFTAGQNIYFGRGAYDPASVSGQRLLSHELTHVIQQGQAQPSSAARARAAASVASVQRHPGMKALALRAMRRVEAPNARPTSAPSWPRYDAPLTAIQQLHHDVGNQATARFLRSVEDQRRAANRATSSILMRQPKEKTEADPCTAPDKLIPVFKDAEQKQRDDILQDMLRGLTKDEKAGLCTRFRRALGAFSTSQMLAMKKAGVRFWRAGEFPPPFEGEYAPSQPRRREAARYTPGVRVIQWGAAAFVDEIRHELAHAWDHVRSGKVSRLDNVKGKPLKKAVETPATFSSETAEKRITVEETVDGKTRKVSLSIQDVYDRYMKLPAPPYWSFANTRTDPEHVTSNVVEFYAEGYSVFHGGDEDAQAKLLCDAPELYQLLEKESKALKLSVPDRSKLDDHNKTNNRKCV